MLGVALLAVSWKSISRLGVGKRSAGPWIKILTRRIPVVEPGGVWLFVKSVTVGSVGVVERRMGLLVEVLGSIWLVVVRVGPGRVALVLVGVFLILKLIHFLGYSTF